MRTLRIVRANLHGESVRVQDMETEVASLFINRSSSSRFEIRSHGVLVEVVDSDREMVHFARWITWPQDEKVFSKHELVVSVAFVHSATENALVEIGRTLQIADVQRDMIDTVALESSSLRRAGAGRQQRQSLNQCSA